MQYAQISIQITILNLTIWSFLTKAVLFCLLQEGRWRAISPCGLRKGLIQRQETALTCTEEDIGRPKTDRTGVSAMPSFKASPIISNDWPMISIRNAAYQCFQVKNVEYRKKCFKHNRWRHFIPHQSDWWTAITCIIRGM